MDKILFYIGIAAIVIFVLRHCFYWGYRKGIEYGMAFMMRHIERYLLNIGKKELYILFIEYVYADSGGDLKKLKDKYKEV